MRVELGFFFICFVFVLFFSYLLGPLCPILVQKIDPEGITKGLNPCLSNVALVEMIANLGPWVLIFFFFKFPVLK